MGEISKEGRDKAERKKGGRRERVGRETQVRQVKGKALEYCLESGNINAPLGEPAAISIPGQSGPFRSSLSGVTRVPPMSCRRVSSWISLPSLPSCLYLAALVVSSLCCCLYLLLSRHICTSVCFFLLVFRRKISLDSSFFFNDETGVEAWGLSRLDKLLFTSPCYSK